MTGRPIQPSTYRLTLAVLGTTPQHSGIGSEYGASPVLLGLGDKAADLAEEVKHRSTTHMYIVTQIDY